MRAFALTPMGSLYKLDCLDSAATAAAYECAASFPRWTPDGQTYQACAPSVAGDQLTITSIDQASNVSTQTIAVVYEACDELADFKDVGELFSMLLVATLLVYLVKAFIYKQVANQ